MKKFLLIAVFVLSAGITYGQTLQKGTVLGFHNGTFVPDPDVTLNQCITFIRDKYFTAYEKNFPGIKCFVLKGIRGENADCLSLLVLFPSDEVRNKYWKQEGELTELGKAAEEKMKPVYEEMNKYGKLIDRYTDWLVL